MKAIARVTGIVVVASAAIFALNLGSAMAAPPPPFEHELLPLQEIDSCILPGHLRRGTAIAQHLRDFALALRAAGANRPLHAPRQLR